MPPSETDGIRNVTFKLSGFESEVIPLSGQYAKRVMSLGDAGIQALHNIIPSPESQYLYYWSFNEETLLPDIAVDEMGAGITFEAVAETLDYPNSTFGVDPYEGGKAFSLRGGKAVELELPLQGVESLSEFAFDISSSGTGPKAFSLSYSVDGGMTYSPIVESQQFDDMGDQKRNPHQFDVAGILSGLPTKLLLKFEFLAGNRGGAGEYNESQGTVRLDNIRLSGVYNGEPEEEIDPSMPDKLHYYVFSSDGSSVIAQEELAIDDLTEEGLLKLKLSSGTYDILFLAYRSDKDLLIPEDLGNKNEFYFGQDFDDHRAITYALLKQDFEVGDTDLAESAVLTRCFSLIRFNFADLVDDLQKITKITVTKSHENYLYTPFGIPSGLPMSDAQSITFSDFEKTEDYQISFHQFLGLMDEGYTYDVHYELTAYGADEEVLNSVIMDESIRNNVQLLFTGKLLGDLDRFAIEINPDWDGTIEHEF